MTTHLGPTTEQITSMRTAVMERVAPHDAAAPTALKPQSAGPRRFGLVAIGIGAIAAALIVMGVIMPVGSTGGATAQAAEFLTTAANATIETSDPVVGPGQYLRISTNSASGASNGGDRTMWLIPTTGVLYIPADRTHTWVWERHELPATVFFGEAGRAAAERYDLDPDNQNDPLRNGVLRAEGGAFFGGSVQSERVLDQLPRDPSALRDHFYDEYSGGSSSIDEDVWVRITGLLRTGEVPADLRAALYRTLALIPGVTITEEEVTLDGQAGVALGRTEPARGSIAREEIIIDPITGLLIGERTVTLADQEDIPAGTTISWSSVHTSVVDVTP
ncbi:hypothetical protein GCM10022381_09500 [Leifsonia kafniensis]|uniref:Uncharacterized protein n=1 Tax=Leifsonia kafniensis TaxID=475957 RepID=A0ABP7K756_9MICO